MSDQPQKPCRSINPPGDDLGEDSSEQETGEEPGDFVNLINFRCVEEDVKRVLSTARTDLMEQDYERFLVTFANVAVGTMFAEILHDLYRELEIEQYGPDTDASPEVNQ